MLFEAIYIIRRREHMRLGESIYKIGMTAKQGLNRLLQYDNGIGTEVYAFRCVSNAKEAEKELKKVFNQHFTSARDETSSIESYRGNIQDMLIKFNQVVNKYPYNASASSSNEPQACSSTAQRDETSRIEQQTVNDIGQDVHPVFRVGLVEALPSSSTNDGQHNTKPCTKRQTVNSTERDGCSLHKMPSYSIPPSSTIDIYYDNPHTSTGIVLDNKLTTGIRLPAINMQYKDASLVERYETVLKEILNPTAYNDIPVDVYEAVLKYMYKCKPANITSDLIEKCKPYIGKLPGVGGDDVKWFVDEKFKSTSEEDMRGKLRLLYIHCVNDPVQYCIHLKNAFQRINIDNVKSKVYPAYSKSKIVSEYARLLEMANRNINISIEDLARFIVYHELLLDKDNIKLDDMSFIDFIRMRSLNFVKEENTFAYSMYKYFIPASYYKPGDLTLLTSIFSKLDRYNIKCHDEIYSLPWHFGLRDPIMLRNAIFNVLCTMKLNGTYDTMGDCIANLRQYYKFMNVHTYYIYACLAAKKYGVELVKKNIYSFSEDDDESTHHYNKIYRISDSDTLDFDSIDRERVEKGYYTLKQLKEIKYKYMPGHVIPLSQSKTELQKDIMDMLNTYDAWKSGESLFAD